MPRDFKCTLTQKHDVRPAPRLRRHRRGAHQQRGQAARPAGQGRPQGINDSVPWSRDFIHTTRGHRTRPGLFFFPISTTHRSSSRTNARFSRGSTWRSCWEGWPSGSSGLVRRAGCLLYRVWYFYRSRYASSSTRSASTTRGLELYDAENRAPTRTRTGPSRWRSC